MYSIADIKKGIQDPSLIRKEMAKIPGRTLNSLRGVDFLTQDWDNIILLDGCRYDLFEDVFRKTDLIDGNLSMVYSNASSSGEYFEKNFAGGEFGDIVYLSANPHIDNIDARFHEIVRLWETDWDDEIGTVLPENAVDQTLEAEMDYENKRIVLHMMQPHRPFLGEHAKDLEQAGLSRVGVMRAPGEDPEVPFWWDRMDSGELTKDDIWPAYRESLEITLPYVRRLIDNLRGKTVVAADHGNAFGEDGITGHPAYTHHKSLVQIPWFESENGKRKDIQEDKAGTKAKQEHFDEATERLRALGYLE